MRITTKPCECCSDTINIIEMEQDNLRQLDGDNGIILLTLDDSELKELAKEIKKRFAKKGFNTL